ncbi:MAG: ATP-dependent zinc metalloprotease FtsH [Epsilonproteobacteria bacterium]|nr:ATP-dependent zinc metalloprotease FtsH [Campylobacterota bacterium]
MDKNNNNNFFNQNPLLAFVIFAIVTILIFKAIAPQNATNENLNQTTTFSKSIEIAYSDLKKLVQTRKIAYVGIGKHIIKAKTKTGEILIAQKVDGDNTLIPLLDKYDVPYGSIQDTSWLNELIFGWIIPVFIFFAIWMFLANRMQKSIGSSILGKSSANGMISSEKPNVTFDDVAGNDEAKEEVKEIVDFLKEPERYLELGAKIPKGVLLVGPPGTGKTLLAKAVAGEADVKFFAVSGSSFIEMFVGVGASRVRDLFAQAKKEAPAIIFIDEIDAIGKSRAAGGMIGGNDEREQTLNQLLAEMDGFDSDVPVIVLAATNRPEVLDPALLRPGRFDRQVLVDKPDFKGRIEILKVHIKGYKISKEVDLEEIAKLTAGLAGADLANIVNEAALLAGRQNKKEIQQQDFLEAIERAIAGLEKKSRRIDENEKNIVAYHESGHALIAQITKGAKKVKKVSIVPRGLAALGYTLNTPEENKYLMQKHELIAEIDVLLGGRAAEEVFIGEISTGASNDLERATDIVKSMVKLYGMSEVAGLMVLEKANSRFLEGGFTNNKDYSEKTAQEVDEYIKTLLLDRYKEVKFKLKEYEEVIEKMVQKLKEKEVITGEEVTQLIQEVKAPPALQDQEEDNS